MQVSIFTLLFFMKSECLKDFAPLSVKKKIYIYIYKKHSVKCTTMMRLDLRQSAAKSYNYIKFEV